MFNSVYKRWFGYYMMIGALALAACAPTAPPEQQLPTVVVIPTQPADAPQDPLEPTPEEDPEPPTPESIDEFELFTDEPPVLGVEGDGLFTVTVTGDVQADFAGVGDFSCDEERHQLSSNALERGNSVYMELPGELAAGEYTIDNANGTNFALLIVDDVVYETEAFGVVTFAAAPTNPDEPVSGSYDLNFVGEDGAAANAVGTFELLAADVCGA